MNVTCYICFRIGYNYDEGRLRKAVFAVRNSQRCTHCNISEWLF